MDARSWKAATTFTCPNYLPDAVSNNKMFVALQGCTIVLSFRCYAVITPPMNARISLSASRAMDEPAIRRPTQTISIKTPGGEEHGLCWVSFWSRAAHTWNWRCYSSMRLCSQRPGSCPSSSLATSTGTTRKKEAKPLGPTNTWPEGHHGCTHCAVSRKKAPIGRLWLSTLRVLNHFQDLPSPQHTVPFLQGKCTREQKKPSRKSSAWALKPASACAEPTVNDQTAVWRGHSAKRTRNAEELRPRAAAPAGLIKQFKM